MDLVKYKKMISDSADTTELEEIFNKGRIAYKNSAFDTRTENVEFFKPILDQQKSIDAKQTEAIEELKKTNASMLGLNNFRLPMIEGSAGPSRQEMNATAERKTLFDVDFNQGIDLDIIKEKNLPIPNDLVKMSDEELQGLFAYVGKIKQDLGRKRGKITRSKFDLEEKARKLVIIEREESTLKTYRDRIQKNMGNVDIIKKGSGNGRKYNQQKRNAYKINNQQYGGLMIDTNKLMNNMVLDVAKNGQKIYETQVDKSTIDLLTKRFNVKKHYSPLARQVFNTLNNLANIKPHTSSMKSKLRGMGNVMYYTDPDQLMERLSLISASRAGGNTNMTLRNESYQIIDELLKKGDIDKSQYDKYIIKYQLD